MGTPFGSPVAPEVNTISTISSLSMRTGGASWFSAGPLEFGESPSGRLAIPGTQLNFLSDEDEASIDDLLHVPQEAR